MFLSLFTLRPVLCAVSTEAGVQHVLFNTDTKRFPSWWRRRREMRISALVFLFFLAGRPDSAHPVLPRLPQGPESAGVPQPGRALRAHQPSPPHGGGQEAQAQLLRLR